jgi:uncharacterized protein (DUF1501 family)
MRLDRRELLTLAIASGAALVVPRALRAGPAGRSRRVLVMLHLEGGNDGLNTVIPWKDPAYRALRPALALEPAQVIPLDERLGLHPGLRGFRTLLGRGRLAIVNGVGYPNPDYSHFRSTDIWYTADPEGPPSLGWLGRALDVRVRPSPVRSAAIAKERPLSLASTDAPAATLTDFRSLALPDGLEGVAALYEAAAMDGGTRGAVGRAGAASLHAAARIASLRPAIGTFRGALGHDLAMAISLLEADLGIETIHLRLGGFDTHANQADAHARLLTQLADGLEAFDAHLERLHLADRVVTVVFSEFGRRPQENASGGTDHGAAAPVFLVGSGLRPGLHGAYPSLTDLDRGNLRFTTDFRRLYAALLRDVLDTDPAPVLGDRAPLEVFA